MGVKISGTFDGMRSALQEEGRRVGGAARDQMARETLAIADLARKMAPVDEYDLEQAIRSDSGDRSADGRTQFCVFVADELNGVDIRDYAMQMHELLGVTCQLGPASLAKQRGQSEIVGGKFLERAFKEREEPLIQAVIAAVKGSLEK